MYSMPTSQPASQPSALYSKVDGNNVLFWGIINNPPNNRDHVRYAIESDRFSLPREDACDGGIWHTKNDAIYFAEENIYIMII